MLSLILEYPHENSFTLVELAIVLIVIGLLIGMAMKGRAWVDSAMVKSDAIKIQRITTAFYTYYTKYNVLPGRRADGTYSDRSIYLDLIKEGILTEKDLELRATKANIHFSGCGESNGKDKPGDKRWVHTDLTDNTHICIYTSANIWSDAPTSSMSMPMPAETICFLETILDDNSIYSGEGRSVEETHSSYDRQFKDCSLYKQKVSGA